MIETSTGPSDFRCSPSQMGEQLKPMSENKYEPDPRLIENPAKLRSLYHGRGLSIREIAKNHASVGRTRVGEALHEHDIIETEESSTNDSADSLEVDWSRMTD